MQARDLVCVVEDDPAVRDSLVVLLRTLDVDVIPFESGDAFLREPRSRDATCVVMDVRMPGRDGLAVHQHMRESGMTMPVVFMTGHGDVPMAVDAVQKGAFDFLLKPFDPEVMLARVQQALPVGRARRASAEQGAKVASRLASLSAREREVYELLLQGRMNKHIAAELGISAKTVEDHRASIMRKMQTRSVVELLRLVSALGPS